MDADLDIRLKRLRYRAWHRGMREIDLILGGFADAHLDGLTAAETDQFESLLGVPDPVLYGWITGREAAPAAFDTPVLRLLRAFSSKAAERS